MRNKIIEILVKHFGLSAGLSYPKVMDRVVFDFELLIGKLLDNKRTPKQNNA